MAIVSSEKQPYWIMNNWEMPDGTTWNLPEYRPGDDPLWDSLGEDWQAIDGAHPDTRMYVRWQVEQGQRPKVTGFCVSAEEVTTDIIRKVPVSRLENMRQLLDERLDRLSDDSFRNLEPLKRAKGQTAESFSRTVALYYKIFAARSSKPTKDLAEHAGVPLPTMRSWIRDARLRGELPPGTPGKSG